MPEHQPNEERLLLVGLLLLTICLVGLVLILVLFR